MKQKVLFVLPSLRGGGAERVMITLLKHLEREKFELYLALVEKEGAYLGDIPKDVNVYDIAAGRVRYSFKPLLNLINKIKPDTVFSTLGHLNVALILLRKLFPSNTRLVVREATIVSEAIKNSRFKFLWSYLYRYFYKKADLIICQSKYMKNDLVINFKIPGSKIVQIYNPVDIEDIQTKASIGGNPFFNSMSHPNIIAVGRLKSVKGFERLISAIPELLTDKTNAKLWIIGEGDLKKQLLNQREELKLEEHVEFHGFEENPYRWMKYADLFILSSYYEGLPNALLEALACGCPVLVCDHPGGTREIMEILGLENRIHKNLMSLDDKIFLRENIQHLFKINFGLEEIIKKYEQHLINEYKN